MMIRSQDGMKIADTHNLTLIVKPDANGRFNVIGMIDGVKVIFGVYRKERTAKDVLDMVWDMILEEQKSFYMPEDMREEAKK